VKKIRRIALIVLGSIFALLAVALLAVNLYVQSQPTQERIQQELSQRLGTTLRIRRISVTPWFGLKLTGITMPQSEASAPGDFLRAETFRLRVRLSSLFTRRLVINEVSLVNPNVLWAQNEAGQWRLPSLPEPEAVDALPAAEPEAGAPGSGENNSLGAAAPAPPTRAPAPNHHAPAAVVVDSTSPSFTPEVRRVNLTNGNFKFLDAKGQPVASFESVGFRSSMRNSAELRGTATIAKISLRNHFFLKDLKSPVRYDPAQLDFSQITARVGGGEISGRFSMRPAETDSPFVAKVAFREVQADKILTDAGGPSGMVRGRIEGKLEAHGETADAEALAGTGEIFLRDGEVRQFSLLVALGQLLQIDELSQLRLQDARVKYQIAPGVVMIDELLLASPDVRLSATGTIDFRGRLKLDSQLAISERVRGRLFAAIRDNFRPSAEQGFTALGFKVTGTIDHPKTNLMGQLVGRDLNDLGGVINSLLGGGRRERGKRRPPPNEPAAPPTPTPADVAPEDAPVDEAAAESPEPAATP
jgi:hypothetical protein